MSRIASIFLMRSVKCSFSIFKTGKSTVTLERNGHLRMYHYQVTSHSTTASMLVATRITGRSAIDEQTIAQTAKMYNSRAAS